MILRGKTKTKRKTKNCNQTQIQWQKKNTTNNQCKTIEFILTYQPYHLGSHTFNILTYIQQCNMGENV